jgi:hypothetical protein
MSRRIANRTNPLAIETAVLIAALENHLVGPKLRPTVVTEKTSTTRAVIRVRVYIAATDRTLLGVS